MDVPGSPGSYDKLLQARRSKEAARVARERVQKQGIQAEVVSPSDGGLQSPSMHLMDDMARVAEAGLFSQTPQRTPLTSLHVSSPSAGPRSPTTIPGSPIFAHATGASPLSFASPTYPIGPGVPDDVLLGGMASGGVDHSRVTNVSQVVGPYDREKYEQRQAQLISELHRLQEVLNTEAAVRRQLEAQNEELRNQLKTVQELPQIQNIDWKHLAGPDKANLLVQQCTSLRDMVLKKVCYQCGLPMNCVPCTPYPVCGLELSEGHNYGIDGVCVITVKDKGPADKAGIMVGDVFTKFNDQPVPTRETFKSVLHSLPPMHPCNFELYRESEGKRRWIHMAGRMILGSSEHFPSSHRTIFHCLADGASVEHAPLGGSPTCARDRGDQRATSPPPYKTSPRSPARKKK